jgi:hypothetical protein
MKKITAYGFIIAMLAICSVSVSHATDGSTTTTTKTTTTHKTKKSSMSTSNAAMRKAVKVAAAIDCGCGVCDSKGCTPCHGKNCYYCVSKALVTNECGCGDCSAKGCSSCGPGCDVCKFNLSPAANGTIPGSGMKMNMDKKSDAK